jgi:hypothetical protein
VAEIAPTWQTSTALLFLQLAYRVQSGKPRFTPGSSSSPEDLASASSASSHATCLSSRCVSLSGSSVSVAGAQHSEESHPPGHGDSSDSEQIQPAAHPRPPP